MTNAGPIMYPLLESFLAASGIALQGSYSLRDVAELFGVSTRTVQTRVKRGELRSRNLPGRAKFLPVDLENFLSASRRG